MEGCWIVTEPTSSGMGRGEPRCELATAADTTPSQALWAFVLGGSAANLSGSHRRGLGKSATVGKLRGALRLAKAAAESERLPGQCESRREHCEGNLGIRV